METRAKWTDLIPDVGLKISEVFDQGDQEYSPGVYSVLHSSIGEGAQKNYTGKTGFGRLQRFEDGDNIPTTARYKTYTTNVVYNNYGEAVEVTKLAIEDRDFGAQLDEMKDMSRATNYSIDESGMQLFNGGFATTTSVNGYEMTWYGDGVPLLSTVHPTAVPGASTQSNASATGIRFNHDNLEVGRLALELQQTDNGKALTMAGSVSIVGPLALEKDMRETTQSPLTPETANNAINVFNGGPFRIVTCKFLDSVNGGSNTAWFLVNGGVHKLYHETRQEKRLEMDVNIRNKVVTFTVDTRWSDHALDFRGVWGSKGDLAAYSS